MKIYLKILFFVDNLLIYLCTYSFYQRIQNLLGYPVVKARFKQRLGYKLNLDDPKTFNEKVAYNLLNNRNPNFPTITDKFAVREYIRRELGEEYLIPLIDMVNCPNELQYHRYPEQFIIKTNFTSGKNIVVRKKSETNLPKINRQLTKWCKGKYGFSKLLWFAQDMPRRILVEELLLTKERRLPEDYKFYCFEGVVKFIEVDLDRFVNFTKSLFTPEWELIPVSYTGGKMLRSMVEVPKPKMLSHMIEVAESLSKPYNFIRVDLYCLDEQVYFGELTVSPTNANGKFSPEKFDWEFGEFFSNLKAVL